MRHPRIAAAAAVLALAAGPGAAQTAAPAPSTDLDSKSGTLSDKLGQTGGVIKPGGDVDPAMRKPAPQTGATPVVKPRQVPPQSGDGTKTGQGGLY